jgi:hypothetical protein
MANFREFKVGQKVRLTGKFLKSTGQHTGGEGRKVFTILGIQEGHGWAVVDEKVDPTYFTSEELAVDPTLAFRRIALANLCIVGQLDSRNCP